MTAEEIKHETQGIVLELLPDVANDIVADDTDIFSLGLDSINAMALVSKLQDAFDISLDMNDFNFENFQNIATITEFVIRKKLLIYLAILDCSKEVSSYL